VVELPTPHDIGWDDPPPPFPVVVELPLPSEPLPLPLVELLDDEPDPDDGQ
jgi:hypothetical protein